ncbi:alpha/beta hydrolase fold domain-containing protein [Massilia sp. Se16.2.3]|uniref:alpha/beta hydrolase fold domain-containing protein n=1 Tax=Massilia sp. Se16.2.3 TaxID=2709303 RepID=UPI001E39DED0|nr:alpha/beta hydrolase fold domain-containing protein [Massilia sp. Se16.2.3]
MTTTTTTVAPIALDAATLDAARSFNRKLARAPRFKARSRLMPILAQALLRLSQVGADRRLARRGIGVETRVATHAGLRVPVRVLRPAAHSASPPRGVVLDIHGGGWVIGNARMNDKHNAALVERCGVAVVSVDYRLATFTPMAGLMDDCLAASRWLLEGGMPELAGLPLIVRGESAGAHLAAATLLRLQAWPRLLERIDGALLYYGVYDMAGTPSVRAAGAETPVLDGPGMTDALRLLTPGLDDTARRAPPRSPLYGSLEGMPPALMFAGSIDPLRDDSILLAGRWRAVNAVDLQLLPEAPHGFLHFPTPLADIALEYSHARVRARLDDWHRHHGDKAVAASLAAGRALE